MRIGIGGEKAPVKEQLFREGAAAKCGLWFRLILFGVTGTMSAGYASETITTVLYGVAEPNQSVDLLSRAGVDAGFRERKVVALRFYAYTTPDGKPVTVELNGKVLGEIPISKDKPEDMLSVPGYTVALPGIQWRDVQKLQVIPQSQSLISKFSLEFEGDPARDLEGEAFRAQLDRLEELSQQNLYEEHNLRTVDVLTRTQAVEDLLQYPSKRAFAIASECFDFHGVWIDFELRKKSLEVIQKLPGLVREFFSEGEATLDFLDLMYGNQHSEIRQAALSSTRDFKTAAPVKLLVRALGDPFRSFDPAPSVLLPEILRKPGGDEALARASGYFHEHLKKLIACGYSCEAWDLWIGKGILESLTAHPQKGYVWVFEGMARKDVNVYELDDAVIATYRKLDMAAEIEPFIHGLGEVITEPYGNQQPYFGFSNSYALREFSARSLAENGSPAAKEYMRRALLIKELEPNLAEIMREAVR